MKKDKNKSPRLTQKDFTRMWGVDGPYSQVRFSEETRILDGSVSRVFLVVEAEVNPFTFEFVKKNRGKFAGDEQVQQLLDSADFRGKLGYVVSAGSVEFRDESAKAFMREQQEMTIKTVMRMHAFVIDAFGLKQDDPHGVIREKASPDARYVWDDKTGSVRAVDDSLWGGETMVNIPAGVKNNKARFFFVLVFEKKTDFKKQTAMIFIESLKTVSKELRVEVEEVESFHEYILLTALVPFDVAPGSYAEAVLSQCAAIAKKLLFQKDYMVTNAKRPTPEQIISFLGQLPLGKDIKMP